jgi:hypothetical protein
MSGFAGKSVAAVIVTRLATPILRPDTCAEMERVITRGGAKSMGRTCLAHARSTHFL